MPDANPVIVPPGVDAGTPIPTLAFWTACAPALLLAVYVGALSSIGWTYGEVNVAEAAAFGDTGEVVRLIAAGANPQMSYVVRGFVLRRDDDVTLTPMEAVIEEGYTVLAGVLLARGAVPDAAQAERLRCLAAEVHREEIAALLAGAYPGQQAACAAVARPW